jgi:hypothetical protein
MPTAQDRWKTTMSVGRLRTTELVALTMVDGAINGELFGTHFCQQLASALGPASGY